MPLALESFHEDLAVCDAGLSLVLCIAASPSRRHSLHPAAIHKCVGQYLTQRKCGSTISLCNQANADALHIYHKSFLNSAEANWALTTIQMALRGTQEHAICTGKSFLRVQAGGTQSQNRSLFNQLVDYLQVRNEAYSTVERPLSSHLTTPSALPGLLTQHDAVWNHTRVPICTYPAPGTLLNSINGTDIRRLRFHFPVISSNPSALPGYPLSTEFRHTQHEGPLAIEATCAKYLAKTEAEFKHGHDAAWRLVRGVALRVNERGLIECFPDQANPSSCQRFNASVSPPTHSVASPSPPTCPSLEKDDPSLAGLCDWSYDHLGNAADKCFTYSKYSIQNLDTGRSQPLHLETMEVQPFCKLVSWPESEPCRATLTQWHMTVACCKSFASVAVEMETKGHSSSSLAFEVTIPASAGDLAEPQNSTWSPMDAALHFHIPQCLQRPDDEDPWCRQVREWHLAKCVVPHIKPQWCFDELETWTRNAFLHDQQGDSSFLPMVNLQCSPVDAMKILASHSNFPLESTSTKVVAIVGLVAGILAGLLVESSTRRGKHNSIKDRQHTIPNATEYAFDMDS
ncbi:unnamed protein product [Aphanomyces euteiches]|nr:hypothetical protein Ae201684P_019805 [Aphanomyces euteiches]KAH9140707.1 hypothetical protein AeRB84_015083 [Aphanomyces euteiches]